MIGKETADGRLAFVSGRLVGVLVHLQGSYYENFEGHWFLEAGFGPCADKCPDPFPSLSAAEAWLGSSF